MAGTLNAVAISGNYDELSNLPTIGNNVVFDVDWTANAGSGDKTVAVPVYTAAITGTMVTALNTVSAGLGTALTNLESQLVAQNKKLLALETALATNKLPNA